MIFVMQSVQAFVCTLPLRTLLLYLYINPVFLQVRDWLLVRTCCRYNCSTLARAQGVRRKNFRLDLTLGSCVKQRIGTASAIALQPMLSASCVTMASSVMPSNVGRLVGLSGLVMLSFYMGRPGLSAYNAHLEYLMHFP